jgi:hypothetical protein
LGVALGGSIEDSSIIVPAMAGMAPISIALTVIGFISFAITLLTLAGMHLLPFDISPRAILCVSFRLLRGV